MDLDGDGRRDVISGSYPGELYVFAGREDGAFAAPRKLTDADGDDLNFGKAAAVYAADWDADGDLDLVVGDVRGRIHWVPNASGGKGLSFGDSEALEAAGEVIRVPRGDAGPCIVDWDGDGTLDLVVGCGDGSVRCYPNAKIEGAPSLGAPEVLLEAPEGGMSIAPGADVRCGARAKPCVVDWDGDGRLDLLVGDVLIERQPPPELTEEDAAERARLDERLDWVRQRYTPAMERIRSALMEELGVDPDLSPRDAYQSMSEEQRAAYAGRIRKAMERDLEVGALQKMLRDISSSMRRFRGTSKVLGHVWLVRRQAP